MKEFPGKKTRLIAKTSDMPGLIRIQQQIHDDAVVISGSLSLRFEAVDLNAWVAEEIETAVRVIKEHGGIVGHVKAFVSASSSCMISATDNKAMVKESDTRRARITLVAILFAIDPVDAKSIIKAALNEILSRAQEGFSSSAKL